MYQENLEDFISDVHDQCKENRCSKCRYYDDNVGTCMFTEDPEDWDLEMIINAYYSKYRETADVQPVKRGRWIETHISLCKWIPENEKEEGHNFYMAELKCSCCKRYNTVTFALSLTKPDFCQLCGARMDGD